MRSIFFLLFLSLSSMLVAQDTLSNSNTSDTLVWHIYVGGKSDKSNRPFEEAVAQKWGFKIAYFYGDCTSTYDYKHEEFKESNKAVFNYLKENFGEDWRIKFDAEVAALRKKSDT